MRLISTFCYALLCAASAGGEARAQVAPRPAAAAAPATRPSLDTLIEQLGDARFAVRDEATQLISQVSSEDLDALVRRYRDEPRYERKLRLRYVIERVYYRRLMAGQVGFLGITPWPLSQTYDPETGQTVDSVLADRVHAEYAAAKAGLRDKDIILAFEDQPIGKILSMPVPRAADDQDDAPRGGRSADPRIDAFTAHVKMIEPGTRVKMRVLRAGPPRKARVTIEPRPEAMLKKGLLAPTVVPRERVYPFGISSGGLVATHVPEGSWLERSGLQAGDAIIGIDGQPVKGGATQDDLDAVIRNLGPGRQILLEVCRLEQVSLTVTLGARPPDMMNQPDWAAAQTRFASWWREQMGEPSVRFTKPRGTLLVSVGVSPPAAPEAGLLP